MFCQVLRYVFSGTFKRPSVFPDNLWVFQLFFRKHVNHTTDLFLYPLKTWENQRFSHIFRGCIKRSGVWNWLASYSSTCTSVSGERNVSFLENFAYVLMNDSLIYSISSWFMPLFCKLRPRCRFLPCFVERRFERCFPRVRYDVRSYPNNDVTRLSIF